MLYNKIWNYKSFASICVDGTLVKLLYEKLSSPEFYIPDKISMLVEADVKLDSLLS